jgi:hypothetical protein
MVLATIKLKTKKAIKLKKAAHKTACRGVNILVVIIVAIELAASWKPLMKSKTKAVTMTSTIKPVPDAIMDPLVWK